MSSEASRPWWATADGEGHLDDRDPLRAHREARRGHLDGDARETGTDEDRPRSERDGDSGGVPGHDPDVCGVCPWCTGLRLLSASHPEAVTHLTAAARHLTQAVRSLVTDLQRPDDPDAPGGDEPFERIDLD